jgi:hypothetical protein
MPMENGRSLYATLAAIDAGFGIVEFNTADLREPSRQPTYADAYRALRDLWNAGARFVSPMAWNGSNGLEADTPEYVSYTAWRNTPLEDAACDFLLERSGLPLGSRLWTFGTASHASDDGWTIARGEWRALPGRLELVADAQGVVTLVSAAEVALASDAIDACVVGIDDDAGDAAIEIAARGARDETWTSLACTGAGDDSRSTTAGRLVAIAPLPRTLGIDRLRITLRVAPGARRVLRRVAVLPKSSSAGS